MRELGIDYSTQPCDYSLLNIMDCAGSGVV